MAQLKILLVSYINLIFMLFTGVFQRNLSQHSGDEQLLIRTQMDGNPSSDSHLRRRAKCGRHVRQLRLRSIGGKSVREIGERFIEDRAGSTFAGVGGVAQSGEEYAVARTGVFGVCAEMHGRVEPGPLYQSKFTE